MELELISENRCFEGRQVRYRHSSRVLDCPMTFSLYLPPQARDRRVPLLYWLSGLTCTDENFVQKAGAQRLAAELGLAILCPDTSPRGCDLPGEEDDWDFGCGAGFYLNAQRPPWSAHYRMYDYVIKELPERVEPLLPVNGRRGISGHSMGGHGALICALKNPGQYASVSAFAPIAAPSRCPWGEKAFTGYLGDERGAWLAWDACALIAGASERLPLLVDQGMSDPFLDLQLKPDLLEAACLTVDHPLELRRRPGYDHSYFFIATYIGDHLHHHARALNA